jgi:hypothetical protein
MSLNIKIVTVDHDKQRYPTVGDWEWSSSDELTITVSNMGDWRKEILVAVHELVEVMLCRERGISQKEVDDFDIAYEANRLPNDTTSEPGDHPLAPYSNEHFFATNIERLFCQELGINWSEYEKIIYSL